MKSSARRSLIVQLISANRVVSAFLKGGQGCGFKLIFNLENIAFASNILPLLRILNFIQGRKLTNLTTRGPTITEGSVSQTQS